PQAEQDHGRDLEQLVEEPEVDERLDPGPRVQDEIGAQDGGDRPRCADHRHRRVRRDRDLRERRHDSAGEVEREVRQPTQPVLDVVSEDPQIEHVRADVEQPAVQEHAREDGRDGSRDIPAPGQVRGDQPVGEEQAVETPVAVGRLDRELDEEHREADGDEADRDHRPAASRIGVTEGDHGARDAFGEVFGEARGELDGPGDPDAPGPEVGVSITASRTAVMTESFVAHTRVAGPPSTAGGMTYMPRTSAKAVLPPASRNWATYVPRALSNATTRALARSQA